MLTNGTTRMAVVVGRPGETGNHRGMVSRTEVTGMERSRLTISRKPGEAVRIGDDVVVRYAAKNGKRITLTIEAPRDRKVQRVELDGPTQTEELVEVG